jgi:hypothetical protein
MESKPEAESQKQPAQAPGSRLRRGDFAAYVPKIFPGLALFPQKDLAFDQAAIAIDVGNGAHLLIGERVPTTPSILAR